jgi:hypothetical protein
VTREKREKIRKDASGSRTENFEMRVKFLHYCFQIFHKHDSKFSRLLKLCSQSILHSYIAVSIQCLPEALSPGIKWPEFEADHSVKNSGAIPPPCHMFIGFLQGQPCLYLLLRQLRTNERLRYDDDYDQR